MKRWLIEVLFVLKKINAYLKKNKEKIVCIKIMRIFAPQNIGENRLKIYKEIE